MRMSVTPVPDANGCTVGSRRQASSVKPKARTTSSSNTFCGSSAKSWSWAVVPAPGGDLLHERRLVLLQVVEEPAHLLRLHPALVVVEHDVVRLVVDLEAVDVALPQVEVLAQHGQERGEVVPLARASTQTGFASAAERDISARSSDGTLLAFSQSRAATRIRLASNESYSCCSPQLREVVDQRCPTSAEVNFWWAIRPTVASCSARSGAPPGGIITCWSQPSSATVLTRSEISARRSRRSSNFAWLTREKPISAALRTAPTGIGLGQSPVLARSGESRGAPGQLAQPCRQFRECSGPPCARAGGPEGKFRGRPSLRFPGSSGDGGRGLYPPSAEPGPAKA